MGAIVTAVATGDLTLARYASATLPRRHGCATRRNWA